MGTPRGSCHSSSRLGQFTRGEQNLEEVDDEDHDGDDHGENVKDHDSDKMVTLSWDAPLVLSIWWESMACLASLCTAAVSGQWFVINV